MSPRLRLRVGVGVAAIALGGFYVADGAWLIAAGWFALGLVTIGDALDFSRSLGQTPRPTRWDRWAWLVRPASPRVAVAVGLITALTYVVAEYVLDRDAALVAALLAAASAAAGLTALERRAERRRQMPS